MRILLFHLVQELSPDGSSIISALLKRAGHEVVRVTARRDWTLKGQPGLEEKMDELFRNTDLVMVAVYSVALSRAIEITEMVHRRHKHLKVIWGGPHCLSAPEQSLQYADGVCYAEGDTMITDLVERMENGTNWLETPNMAFRVDGKVVRNPVLPPLTDLDSLPYPDVSIENHYILEPHPIPLTKEKCLQYNSKWPLGTPIIHPLTSRGCPYVCSYCNNVRYVSLYGHNRLRFHSIDYVIGMLENTLSQMDFCKTIYFGDDDFLVRPEQELAEFAEKYKKRIGLPFIVMVSGTAFRESKFKLLLSCGLIGFKIGIQSGSKRVLSEVFNRKIDLNKAKDAIWQIDKIQHSGNLKFFLIDFIIDNPYETPEDIMASYDVLLEFYQQLSNKKAPWVSAQMYYLTFTPGTPLMERAIKDGIIKPDDLEGPVGNFHRQELLFQKNYETFLLMFFRYLNSTSRLRYVPRFVLRLLGSRFARSIAGLIPGSFYASLAQKMRRHGNP